MKIAVIGGGAAGFMAAITAAESDVKSQIIIFEKTKKLLSKVLVSGGGRCNVTNAPKDIREFAMNYPRGNKEMYQLLHAFGPEDTCKWFEHRSVKLKMENDGRVFPVSNKSSSIINCLIQAAQDANIQIETSKTIISIIPQDNYFKLSASQGEEMIFDKVIIACGGSSKISSYQWLSQLGLEVKAPYPSLFTFNCPGDPLLQLAGISVPQARVSLPEIKLEYTGPVLITHWGFSGPAVLKLSAWGAEFLAEKNYRAAFSIHWLPQYKKDALLNLLIRYKANHPNKSIRQNPFSDLPTRLWHYFIQSIQIKSIEVWQEADIKWITALSEKLSNDSYQMQGKTTFKEEFVTAGGISRKEINFKTMESQKIPRLFFAGEIIDIDGITGGYNFQCAWSTGYVAGKSVIKNS